MTTARHRHALVPGAIALAVLLAACGSRADSTLHANAARAALDAGSGVGGVAVNGTGASSNSNNFGGSTTGAGTGTTPGSSGLDTTTSGGSTSTGSAGNAATGSTTSKNGGATDVGVTATSITVGNISDRTGPVPGLFQGAAYGVDAYFAYINGQGGVGGRQLVASDGDGQTSCAGDANATEASVGKVFAFVGSFAIYDDCGTKVLESKKYADVASVSYALGNETKAFHNNYSPQAAPVGYQTGMFRYWAKKYGSAVTKVGSVYPNIAAAATSQDNFESAAGSVGWHWIYSQSYPATQSNWSAEVAQMKLKGVQLVFMSGQTAEGAATIVNEAASQNWHPIFVAPIAYASDFLSDVGNDKLAEGITGSNLYALFFNRDEARNLPGVALYQHWMNVTHPDAAVDLYSMFGWASAMLFVQALRETGPAPTRVKLLTALRGIRSFDADGILPTSNPAQKKPPLCYLLWTIHNGAFVREATPAQHFRCDGTFHYTRG